MSNRKQATVPYVLLISTVLYSFDEAMNLRQCAKDWRCRTGGAPSKCVEVLTQATKSREVGVETIGRFCWSCLAFWAGGFAHASHCRY